MIHHRFSAPLTFGKYHGKSLPWLLFHDPDYFFWAFEEGIFRGKGLLCRLACELYKKATLIRIPDRYPEGSRIEYVAAPRTRKFVCADLNTDPDVTYRSSNILFGSDHLDLSMPRRLSRYDKSGAKEMVRTVKQLYFGDTSYRMTDKRCREFFANDDNFLSDEEES